jgi:hypothetical protein
MPMVFRSPTARLHHVFARSDNVNVPLTIQQVLRGAIRHGPSSKELRRPNISPAAAFI